jgi:hypothetical protein
MKSSILISGAAVVAIASTLFVRPASATSLTGLIEFSTDASGSEAQGEFWDTVGGNSRYNLYVAPGPISAGNGFVNHGNGLGTAIDIPLTAGSYTFTIIGADHPIYTPDALNLFFDGDTTTPGISVVAPIRPLGAAEPAFSADSGAKTPYLSAVQQTVPGAGTLTYTDAFETVTLTDYFWERSTTVDLVTGFSDLPGSPQDFTGQFTITVIDNARTAGGIGALPVPEPATMSLMATALFGIGAVRRMVSRKILV